MAVRRSPVPGHFRMWLAEGPPLPFDHPRQAVHCLLGPTRPRVIRGYGGWGQTERTGRRAVSTYEGSETLAVEITLWLENKAVPTEGGVVGKIANIERLTMPRGDEPPPPVKWAANHEHDNDSRRSREWVCESLEWGDAHSGDRANLRHIQATIVLAVLRDTELDVEEQKGFDRRTLQKGQDLRAFARKWLGDPKRWRDVASLNRDNPRCPQSPQKEAKKDTVLLVPLREPKGKSKRGKGDGDKDGKDGKDRKGNGRGLSEA
jgi:hypothetical protein